MVAASCRAAVLLAGMFLLASLAACTPSARQDATTQAGMMQAEYAITQAKAGDDGVFVILPEQYGNYLDSGLTLAASGAAEDLPVYRSKADAFRALLAFETRAEYSRHLWDVFRLDAEWSKDVVAHEDEFRLAKPARILEMIHKKRPATAI